MNVSRFLPCALLILAGCSGAASEFSGQLEPVSGKVLLNGSPGANVNVSFVPTGETQGTGGDGTTNAQGVFTILIKPESLDLSPEQKEKYLNLYTKFGAFLISAGYKGEGILDSVTQCILQTIESSPIPKTLAEL